MATITFSKGERVEIPLKLGSPELEMLTADLEVRIGTSGSAAVLAKDTTLSTTSTQDAGLVLMGSFLHVTLFESETASITPGSYIAQVWARRHHLYGDRLLAEFTVVVKAVVA